MQIESLMQKKNSMEDTLKSNLADEQRRQETSRADREEMKSARKSFGE
jgi:hypothetical protein